MTLGHVENGDDIINISFKYLDIVYPNMPKAAELWLHEPNPGQYLFRSQCRLAASFRLLCQWYQPVAVAAM